MDIRTLSYFIEVARQGSFTKAAQKLNISQPALSKSIQNLESEIGVPLFVRTRGNLELTEGGKSVLASSEDLLIHFNCVQDRFESIRRGERENLSVGFSPLLSFTFGRAAVSEFFSKHRGFGCLYRENVTAELIRRVSMMRLDLAVCCLYGREYPCIDGVTLEPLYQGELVAVVAGEAGRRRCEYADDLDLTGFTGFFPNEISADRSGIRRPERLGSVFYTDCLEALITAEGKDRRVTVVPDIACSLFPPQTRFLRFRAPVRYEAAVATKRDLRTQPNIRMFKRFITSNFERIAGL